MIGNEQIRQIAVALTLLVAPSASFAQQPGGGSGFGVSELFKKPVEPQGKQLTSTADQEADLSQRCNEYLARGVAYSNDQRYAEAELQFAAAAALAGRIDGSPSFLIMALYSQAYAVAHQGRLVESISLIEKARTCQWYNCFFDVQSFEFLFVTAANIYTAAGRTSDLEPILRQLFSQELRLLGEDHRAVNRHATFLGDNLVEQGKLVEAEKLFVTKLSHVEKNFPPESPELDEALRRLLVVYHGQGKGEDAERLLQRILSAREVRLGRNHVKVAETLETYALWLRKTGRDTDADRKEAHALLIRCGNGLQALAVSLKTASSIGGLNRSTL